MKKTFTVTIKNKETGKVYQEQVNSDEYILKEFEKKGFKLAFSCRNGCCTSCAVKIIILGEVAERLKAQHWKCCIGATLSRVRIPLSPFYISLFWLTTSTILSLLNFLKLIGIFLTSYK